jgi:carboxyl-terminal processing protease
MYSKLVPKITRDLIFTFLVIIFFTCCNEKDDVITDPVNTDSTYIHLFNQIWSDFDQTYPNFTYKNIDWDSVYNVYNSKIDLNTTQTQLYNIVGQMTMSLKDVHVRFGSGSHYYQYSPYGLYNENPPDNAINYLENVSIDNASVTFADIKGYNYNYLRIKNLWGDISNYNPAILKLRELSNKDGLIIDIRSNGGGNEAIGREFAGMFTNITRAYKYTRYRNGPEWDDFTNWYVGTYVSKTVNPFGKKIILLTNRYVISSAEAFTLMMNVLPNVISVGDTTYGASANPKEYVYLNLWTCRISTWQAVSIDYKFIEDVGIAPDYYVEMTASSIAIGKDLILEKAINLLTNK